MPRRIPLFLLRSVRGRLILLVTVIVAPVLFLAAVLIIQAYRNERAAVAQTLVSTARAVCGVIDREVDNADSSLRAIAAELAMNGDDLALVDTLARASVNGTDRWFVLVDPSGQQRVNTRVPLGTPLPHVQIHEEVLRAVRQGQVYASDLQRSQATHEMVLHIARGYFRDGALKYILTVSITPNALGATLQVDRFAPNKIVTVLDRTGTIAARSRAPEKFVGGQGTPDIVAAIHRHPEGVIDSVTLEHIPVVTAFSRAQCGWFTAIGIPKSQLYDSAQRLLVWGVLGSAVLIVLVIAVALSISRALVRSVDLLAASAEALGRGQMPQSEPSGLDEADFVATAMRRTAATLLRRTRTLVILNRVNAAVLGERNVEEIIQTVTNAGREISGAHYTAFLARPLQPGETAENRPPRSATSLAAFAQFGIPLDAPLLQPTFEAVGVVRIADLTTDSRYPGIQAAEANRSEPPVRAYLAVPVKSRSGDPLGGLFFGHPEPGVFTDEMESVLIGLANEAAIAIDSARLYQDLARELQAKSKAEADLRAAQIKLRDHAEQLERNVEERTASLREAVTQMEEFSYTVSHDLRGPLRAMHSFADALVEDYGPQLDETARDYLRRIQRASQRMERLTTDLLSYSRVARAEVRLEPVLLEPILRSTIEHYPELQSPQAHVEVFTPLHPICAHEPSLTQCLANLLTNAAKFVRPGEKPEITVRTEKRGERVRIWVEDNGIGIPAEHQAGLFRIFERAPTRTTYEGTGVGLAIVRKAAEKMDGTCGVESDGRTGSRFWVELKAP